MRKLAFILELGYYPKTRIFAPRAESWLPVRNHCFGSVQANAICSQMPDSVVRQMGAALSVAQYGGKHPDAKPWKGLGPGVFEVVSDYRTDTFRAGYVVRFENALYVLHCFQKKSPSGTRTAKTDVEMIERRLKVAQGDYEARYGQASQKRE